MNKKLSAIILLAVILVAGFLVFDYNKENVYLEVHGEKISNSTDIFVVCTVINSNGNLVDTNYGKLNIGLYENDGCCGVIYEDCPLYHVKCVSVFPNDYGKYDVHYDGGYFYKPADVSGDLIIKNQTNLTYDDITRNF